MKKIQDIVEEFNQKFPVLALGAAAEKSAVRDFLQTTLTSHTESIIKELEGMRKCYHIFPAFKGTCQDCGANRTTVEDDDGYNQGIHAAIQALKSSLQGE